MFGGDTYNTTKINAEALATALLLSKANASNIMSFDFLPTSSLYVDDGVQTQAIYLDTIIDIRKGSAKDLPHKIQEQFKGKEICLIRFYSGNEIVKKAVCMPFDSLLKLWKNRDMSFTNP